MSGYRFGKNVARPGRANAGKLVRVALAALMLAAAVQAAAAEDTVKVATAEAFSDYKLYPWTHKQINVPHAYRRIKGLE